MPKKNKLKTKLRRTIAQLSYLPQTFRLVWDAAHNWTLAWVILLVVQGLLPVATVYLTRYLVNSLVAIVGKGKSWDNLQPILIPAALMAGVLLLTELLRSAITWVRTAQSELVQDKISGLIQEKSAAVDLAFYESSEYYDHLNRARSDASSRSLSLLENSGSLLQNSITLLAMAGVLIPYGVWIPFVLLISTLPAFYVVLRLNRHHHKWWQETTPERRWLQYYEMLLTQGVAAAEVRLFNLGPHFQAAYQTLRRRLRTENLQLIKNQSLARLGAGAVGIIISSFAMAWMVWQLLLGLMTLGDLALFYQAFNQSQNLMRSLLGNLGQIHTNSLFLSNLFEFLQLKPQILDPEKPVPVPTIKKGIEFRQVTFRYPGSKQAVFENFNLSIAAGQVVALVGDNGAGKSTLIKLLCRFYDPEAGCIELDGIDIRELSISQLQRAIAVLFQSPIPYQATAADNIALGDLAAAHSAVEIEAAAIGAGAHEIISRLPKGYDTQLGKSFVGGTELSGGEWQRVALARAFFRRSQIIILDEPTSAMDSWAEADWLERFRTLANGRTAIVITHRFTLAMRADIIHVMRDGQIVESGNHDQLLAQAGLYAQSWTAQMQVSSSSFKKGLGVGG
ncbi:MAG: ABC transporter ATP-binding protein/permease [Gloeocapsa sp. UFS-A4-WI-NPMV-4B04]|jgi:ATP-binding cassette subfamily B protein|nr:ABC transporter ATP-binding protein/permease [Gloeocapsa sp. UFS-A4-WI-NPMV-4B04]